MLRHVVSIIRIIWWGKIATALWPWLWRTEYAPYTNLQYLCLPQYVSQYYSQQFYHTYLVRRRWISVYVHGGFCHIEIELRFTPKWRTLQFFIKDKPYGDWLMTNEYKKKTTCGQFFNTFTNRERWYR